MYKIFLQIYNVHGVVSLVAGNILKLSYENLLFMLVLTKNMLDFGRRALTVKCRPTVCIERGRFYLRYVVWVRLGV